MQSKLGYSTGRFYVVIFIAGILTALAILAGLLYGIKLNYSYSELYRSAVEIHTNTANARLIFLQQLSNPSAKELSRAWDYLESVEQKAKTLADQISRYDFIFSLSGDSEIEKKAGEIQTALLNYRNLSNKLIKATPKEAEEAKNQWDKTYADLSIKSEEIENRLERMIARDSDIFISIQITLILATLVLTLITLFVFVRYGKQKSAYIRDITIAKHTLERKTMEKKQTEYALQETERKHTTLLKNLPGMVYRCKVDDNITMEYVSQGSQLITGYKPEELIDNKVIAYGELVHPEDKTKIRQQIMEAVETRKAFQLVYRIKTAGGYTRWVWERGVGIFSETEDELIALEGFITDITEQKAVEEQLYLQSTALEAAANAIVITDKEGVVLWANSAFSQLTGYLLNDILGKKLNLLKSGKHDNTYYEYMWDTIKEGKTWRGEIINKRKDGSLYDEEMVITPVTNTQGEIIHFVAIKQDITERKLAQQALVESELRFRGLYENATIGIYRTTPDGKILLANPTLVKMLGYNNYDEMVNLRIDHVYLDKNVREKFKQQIYLENRLNGFEAAWKKADGTIIYVRESARAVRDPEGRILYYEGSVEDVTEKKKAEQELILAKERAEQSDKLKTEFLSQMSHEIRTPMNVIISFANLLKEELSDKVDDEIKNSFDVIDAEGKRIMRTVELILDMSEIQTGQFQPKFKEINLFNEVLKPMHTEFLPAANEKNLLFELYKNTDLTNIIADEYSIKQIFKHLIENAIKYTEKGKIEISIAHDPNQRLYVQVADTGIGIADEYLPLLFTPFTKEEMGYTRKFEGNGLGLALVKKYCEANNAEIKVVSKKGKGSIFRVTFLQPHTTGPLQKI